MFESVIRFLKYVKKSIPRKKYIVSKAQDEIIKKISKGVSEYCAANYSGGNRGAKILYIPSFYSSTFPRVFDIFMADALKLRGCRITSVITGDFYEAEDIVYGGVYNEDRQRKIKEYDYIERLIWRDVLAAECLELRNLKSARGNGAGEEKAGLITIGDYPEFYYKGYPAGEQAAVATMNMNNMPLLSEKPDLLFQLRAHAKNIIRLFDAYEKIFDSEKYDAVFSNVPFYYKWGVPFYIAGKRGIPFYWASIAERKNTFFFSMNNDRLVDSSPAWPSFKEKKLDDAQKRMLDGLIEQRTQKSTSHYIPLNQSDRADGFYSQFEKKLDKNKKTVLFPVNVCFDAVAFKKTKTFENIVEMIKSLILFFNENSQYNLIIKAHPVEKFFYDNPDEEYKKYCLKNLIAGLNLKLGDNIFFVDYNSKISLNDVIGACDLGVVFTSTVAIEMAWYGKPVITVADTHYKGKGFTYEPESAAEFFQTIKKILSEGENEGIIKERIELSKKYYLFFYYYAMVDFKLLQGIDVETIQTKFLFDDYEKIMPGRCEALDYICDSIMEGKPVYGDNRWPPPTI